MQVFRRKDSPYTEASFKLSGLQPEYHYYVTNLDEPHIQYGKTGEELMNEGLMIRLENAPQAATISYFLFAKSFLRPAHITLFFLFMTLVISYETGCCAVYT